MLVTNAHQKSLELKMAHTQLAHKFDLIISAHSFGLPKEEPLFWKKLLEKHYFNPQSSLFIDDSLPVLRSADKFGIKYLVCIEKPSSQKPVREIAEFPMLSSFTKLIL